MRILCLSFFVSGVSAWFPSRSSPLKMFDSNILTFMDMVVKENAKYDDINDIEKVSPYPTETSYGDLLSRIDKHETERIFLNPSLDTVVSLQHAKPYLADDKHTAVARDDCSYDITRISPVITNDLVEISRQYGVDTVFLGKLPTQSNPVLMTFGQIYGVFESFIFPSIAILFVLSFISSFIAMGINAVRAGGGGKSSRRNGNFPGSGDGMFSGPFINGLSDIYDPDDLKARLKSENISLASFAGSPEILQECTEVVSYLKNATKYEEAGAVLPRGILLEGPPGTGKTLLAKAIASECDAAFLAVSGSEFVEMFVGVGAQKIRELFSVARENTPCIIFIDEIDTIGKMRGGSTMPGNEEREQTLNQLLSEMDGFADNKNVLVLAATNRRDILDSALMRPGRFDRIIRVPSPDRESRLKILQQYIKNKQFTDDVDLWYLAELTSGFTGAQLRNLLNEAAIYAVRDGRTIIQMSDINQSLDKLMIGIIKKIDTRIPTTKKRVAVHEAGHAVLIQVFSSVFELKKISIQSTYNGAGGFTVFQDRRNVTDGGLYTKDVLFKRLIVSMGGKAAESVIYGEKHVSLGATQDLQQANELARKMITQFGFGANHLETYFEKDMSVDFGKSTTSEWMKQSIDSQVSGLVESAYHEAKRLLVKHIKPHEILVDRLIVETIITEMDL